MKFMHKSRQLGISFIGLIFVGGVLAVPAWWPRRCFRRSLNIQADRSRRQQGGRAAQPGRGPGIFDKAATIDDITSIKGKDLEVTKDGDQWSSICLQKEIHLAGLPT
jgi:hypothetical protein